MREVGYLQELIKRHRWNDADRTEAKYLINKTVTLKQNHVEWQVDEPAPPQ